VSRDAREELRQRLVDGVQGHRAGQIGVDVDVEARVAREREQQLLHAHVVHHHAVSLGPHRGLGLRQHRRELNRRRDRAGERRLLAQMRIARLERLLAATGKHCYCDRG
jgi:hypothetical protein